MKILIISSFYPPYFVGGYELRAKQMVKALRERKHDVFVLTSQYGLGHKSVRENVYRALDARPDLTLNTRAIFGVLGMLKIEYTNHHILKKVFKEIQPDIILVMHIHSLLKSLMLAIKYIKIPVAYDISDPALMSFLNSGDKWNKWFDWWEKKSPVLIKKYVKLLLQSIVSKVIPTSLGELPLDRRSYFTSKAIKQSYLDSGFPVEGSPVLPPGICLSDFPFMSPSPKKRDILKLLYTGRIAPEKGIETAIEALSIVKKRVEKKVQLTIAGPSTDVKYYAKLNDIMYSLALEKEVVFLPSQPLERMPTLYQAHDLFIFPAVWEEPFGRSWIEALASGLPLITTATGGAKDYLCHKENCLIFPPGDKVALADLILTLMQDDGLLYLITKNGRHLVEKHFSFSKFIDALEIYLARPIHTFALHTHHPCTRICEENENPLSSLSGKKEPVFHEMTLK